MFESKDKIKKTGLFIPECIPCIVKQSYSLCNLLGIKDESLQKRIIFNTMESLLKETELISAPHFSTKLMSIITPFTSEENSFANIKRRNILAAEKYIKYLDMMMEASPDKLETAVRIAITGNIIDIGANPNFNLENEVNKIASSSIFMEPLELLREKLNKANTILYIADNYEEALFDKYLLKLIKDKKVFFAVRSAEILNDITYNDALDLEIDKICTVFESGSKIAGTDLANTNEFFNDIYENADVIIAKGQGNFETLLYEDKPIFFMFKVKCNAVAKLSKHNLGSGVLLYNQSSQVLN